MDGIALFLQNTGDFSTIFLIYENGCDILEENMVD